ncbi:hypothetical protein MMA231_00268 [Asticcacaulis sp. MM231]|uniref:hypothetical protein n=1 Tax=Asticcacaulis sp. MM231 TaxID=3157666 RepID=UPI0032D5AAF9
MLPIYLKFKFGLFLRAFGFASALFLFFFAWILWQMSGVRIEGWSLSFPQLPSIIFGHRLDLSKPGLMYRRVEYVGLAFMFIGFAVWNFTLVFRSDIRWTITEEQIERRIGARRDVWLMSSVVATQLYCKVQYLWAAKLQLKSGKWLRLPWIETQSEAEAVIDTIKSLIARR